MPIFLPPLRDRKEDIPVLTEHFLKKFNSENRKSLGITAEALKLFSGYDWPGNVRELENTIERLVVMSVGKSIERLDLPLHIREQIVRSRHALPAGDALSSTVEHIEKTKIINALKQSGWVQAKAARILNITARQIGYKIKKYNISR